MRTWKTILTIGVMLVSGSALADKPMWVGLYPTSFNIISPKEGTWLLDLHTKPNKSSPKLGALEISFSKRHGFTLNYITGSNTGQRILITSDLYEQDWGYGPYFHQTALSVKNNWVLLPKNPFKQNVWVNVGEVLGKVNLETVRKDTIYNFRGRSIYVVKIESGKLTVRDEQKADMWCRENPPPLQKYVTQDIPFNKLYGKDSHLDLKIKYTRGC